MTEINKDIIKEILDSWQKGMINEQEVHEKAENLWNSRDSWPDYPNSDSRSIPVEVLSQLEILNNQLIIKEDIPIILEFLETPVGNELEGWERWKEYWDNVNFSERKKSLKNNPYYS